MFTKASKPYNYPFLESIFAPTGSTGLQYDLYPMSIELNSRFFLNLVHGENVVLEASINLFDLTYLKALRDGTIVVTDTYVLEDDTVVSGLDLVRQIDDLIKSLNSAYERHIGVFEEITGSTPTFIPLHAEEAPKPKVVEPERPPGVDVHEIYERLSKRSGKISPDA